MQLIAVYILSGEPLDVLLKALHDDPEAVDQNLLDGHIYGRKSGKDKIPGLESKSETVARLVRGGDLRPGPTTSDLSRREEEAAAYIRFQRSRGASDDKILQNLREGFGFSKLRGLFADPEEYTWGDMTMDELKRLGKFQLPSMFGDGT